jgi:hypothetical protein
VQVETASVTPSSEQRTFADFLTSCPFVVSEIDRHLAA